MTRKTSTEQIKKMYEAHAKGISIPNAAVYARVSNGTVSRYWALKGLRPHFKQELTTDQINRIYEAHELGMSAHKTGEYAGVSGETVLKYWEKKELEHDTKQRVTEQQLEKILEAHRLGMSTRKAERHSDVDRTTIRNYWKARGLETNLKSGGQSTLTQEQIDRIYEAHGLGMSLTGAGDYAGVNPGTVLKRWRKKGLKPHFESGKGYSNLKPEQINTIYEAHSLGFSDAEIADLAEVSLSTVRKYRKQERLKANIKDGGPLPQEQIDKIYEAHKLGLTTLEASEFAGVSNGAVTKYWKKASLEAHFKKDLAPEQIEKIYKSHELEMTLVEAAKFSGASDRMVLEYWNRKGLEAHFKGNLTQEQIDRIYEAHKLGFSIGDTAEYAGVCAGSVVRYWEEKKLKPNFELGIYPKRCYQFGEKTAAFDSNPERVIGMLLNKYGLIPEFEEGGNLHVRTNGRERHSIDFLVGNTFIEYHPLSMSDRRKGLTLVQAGEKKRRSVTDPRYQNYPFKHIWKVRQLYGILQDATLNQLVDPEYRNISFEQFKGHVTQAYREASAYDARLQEAA